MDQLVGRVKKQSAIEISQSYLGIKLHQYSYYSYLINKFSLKYRKPRKTPFLLGVKLEEAKSTPLVNNTMYRHLAGSLLYLTHTRLDIYYAVTVEYINM